MATQYAPVPLLPPVGAQAPREPPSRRNVALLSYAEYVPTLTAAAALRFKAALSKAAWWPWPLTSWPWKWVTCDVGYLCANFGLPRPLCSRLRPDVRDRRQTDRHQTSDSIIALCTRLLGREHNKMHGALRALHVSINNSCTRTVSKCLKRNNGHLITLQIWME